MPKTTHNYQNDSDTSEQSEQITLLNDVEGILEALASELLEVAAGEQLTQGRAILGQRGLTSPFPPFVNASSSNAWMHQTKNLTRTKANGWRT